AFVGDEVLERREQEGSKSADARIGPPNRVRFKQPGQESLHQVLGVLGAEAVAPSVRIERAPIVLAQVGERFVGSGGRLATGGQDDAPARRGECWRMPRTARTHRLSIPRRFVTQYLTESEPALGPSSQRVSCPKIFCSG